MDAIVAVYDDWGIGRDGSQPLTLSADRKYFRETTAGAAVIAGRKTLLDFPGGRPLPKRVNLILTHDESFSVPGGEIVHSVEEAVRSAQAFDRAFVIGGARVYRQMLPYCDTVYVTKIHVQPESDVFFPNLDEDPAWSRTRQTQTQWENGVAYEFCVYERGTAKV